MGEGLWLLPFSVDAVLGWGQALPPEYDFGPIAAACLKQKVNAFADSLDGAALSSTTKVHCRRRPHNVISAKSP